MIADQRLRELRNMTAESFYAYVKHAVETDPHANDTTLLRWEIARIDRQIGEKISSVKEWFYHDNQHTIEDVVSNIERTQHGQPIYREISVCVPKRAPMTLHRGLLRNPIGTSWAYVPETYAFDAEDCPRDQEQRPILIKGSIRDPEGIDIDRSVLLNLNWSQNSNLMGSEHEIRLKNNVPVHVEEMCEKNWFGRRSSSGLPMRKQCVPLDQMFTS